jgi:hypothetical protein
VCCGKDGWVFEVTPDGRKVWEYVNDFGSDELPENAPPHMNGLHRTALFRATRVAPSHPGLVAMQL